MRPILGKPYFVILLSFIPGLPIWLFGKRKLALTIAGVVLLALSVFFPLPTFITWYIFGILYLAQMVYSVYLSVWTLPTPDRTQIPDANLPVPLPDDLRRSKHMGQDVIERMAKSLHPNLVLTTAILGVDLSANQLQFIGVTGDDLVLTNSTTSGMPRVPTLIPKSDVAWVNLQIGERNCLISFRFEEESRPTITLHIPGRLREQAKEIVHEFPGAWSRDNSFSRVIESLHKLEGQPEIILIPLILFGLVVLGLNRLPGPILLRSLVVIPVLFFLMGWPLVIWILRLFHREPGLTSGNIFVTLLIIPGIIFTWGMALGLAGTIILGILQAI